MKDKHNDKLIILPFLLHSNKFLCIEIKIKLQPLVTKSEPNIIKIIKVNKILNSIICSEYFLWENKALYAIIVNILWKRYMYKEFLPHWFINGIFIFGTNKKPEKIIIKDKIIIIILWVIVLFWQ